MGVRNCAEIGENLQKVMNRLTANQLLLKLLFYADSNPLGGADLTETQIREQIFNKLITVIPNAGEIKTAQSKIIITVIDGAGIEENSEFKTVNIDFLVVVPQKSILIQDSNLRPFAILGEIQKSLQNKTINGLGKMTGGDFEISVITEEFISYTSHYQWISYD